MSTRPVSPEEAATPAAVRKRCPLDVTVLVLTEVDGIPGWLCPECGYFEPV